MDLNIKGVDPDFVSKCKMRAYSESLTLKAWVMEILREAINGDGRDDVRVRGSVARGKREGAVVRAVHEAPKQAGSQPESSSVGGSVQKDRGRKGTAEKTALDLTGARVEHDPKSCRLYACGMCRSLGHSNPGRGLK